MCRVIGYLGPSVPMSVLLHEPDSSLVRQAYDPKMLHMLNLAGFGLLAWDRDSLHPEVPFTYRSVSLPMFDANLRALSDKIAPQAILAHIRGVAYNERVTLGEQNLHPFRFPGVSLAMAHNGDLAHFSRMRFALANYVRPDLAGHIKGNTDSEWVYALIVSQLADPGAIHDSEQIFEAVSETLKILRRVREEHDIATSSSLNLFISNGSCMVCVRYTFDFGCYDTSVESKVHEANLRYLSLWYTLGQSFGCHDGEWKMGGGSGARDAVLIASEPLSRDVSTWLEVPEYSALLVRPTAQGYAVSVRHLD